MTAGMKTSEFLLTMLAFALGVVLEIVGKLAQTEATQMLPQARGHGVATFAAVFFAGQAAGVAAGGAVFDQFGGAPLFLASAACLLALGTRFARALARDYAR